MTDENIPIMIEVKQQGEFEQLADKTLLQTLEHHQLEVHYHCREGFCGACRTKILKGSVEYLLEPLAFIDDDEILPCCCRATSHVEIDID